MSDIEFLLPDVGEGLADATIASWLVAEGDRVVRMESMVEIETDKSVTEIPSPVDGVMVRHGAAPGESLDVGALLAVLRADKGEEGIAATVNHALADSAAPSNAVNVAESSDTVRPGGLSGGVGRVRAAPTVRRRAREAGIDLTNVPTSGDGGRVLMSDLEAFLTTGGVSQADPTDESPARLVGIQTRRSQVLSPMRTAIFEAMSRAWEQVPLITDMRESDAAELVRLRPVLRNELDDEVRLTFTTLFSMVVISALRRHPEFNVLFDSDTRTVTYHEHVNLGLAVSVPGGLSVGVVHQADSLSATELSQALDDVARRARDGKLTAADMSGATVTLTSFGTHGGWFGTPLVVPPQALIVGFGSIRDRVVAVDGKPVVRATVPLSVSADHRVIDGAELSTFCSVLEGLIAEPARMVMV